MDNSLLRRTKARKRRQHRVRNQVRGSATKPRLTVSKTNRHIYAQIIDDEQGLTLASFGTQSKESQGTDNSAKSKKTARFIGQRLAELAKEKDVSEVVFDRGRYKYHGLIAELADGARKSGLRF